MSTDRIEKTIVLKASRERVWRAISDSEQFGAWFGMDCDGPFVAGEWLEARIVPTRVDPAVAKMQEPYRGMPSHMLIEEIRPMERFAFRWHPGAIDPDKDYRREPTTLVNFELSDAPGGVRLTITESGFDAIPLERRAEAFKGNEEGWEHQLRLIATYLAQQGEG